MRLGIIGYSNSSGLGIMTADLIRIFNINYHLIVSGENKGTFPELSPAKYKTISPTWCPSDELLENFLKEINIIITVETTYHPKLFEFCRRYNVKSVHVPMWEWWEYSKYGDADISICTSRKTYEYVSENSPKENQGRIINLPWPIDTERFKFRKRGKPKNTVFVHNAGFGGLNWRKGTLEATEAFMLANNPDIRLLLRSQFPIKTLPNFNKISNDNRIYWEFKEWQNNYEMYEEGDVYLYPARYDGQALVAEEAMACGFPVFVTDAEPMNEFSDNEFFKIKLKEKIPIQIHNHQVDMKLSDVNDLAEKIEQSVDMDLSIASHTNRIIIETEYSWLRWKSRWEEVIHGY